MRRGVGPVVFAAGVLAGVLLSLFVQELWPAGRREDLEHYSAVRDFAREAFVREVSDEELLDLALHGMLKGLDGYSRFYDREESAALTRETSGRYRGVGVVFRRPTQEGRVLYPLSDSPAARAGVRVGDRFLSVDGRSVEGMSEGEFRALLRDPARQVLDVRVMGLDGEERELSIEPDSIVDPTVRHARMIDPELGIGYLAIVSFSDETREEFDQAFGFLRERGMRALVLDLRHDLGGVLDSAVSVARRFIREGPIVSTEGRGEPLLYSADPEEALYAGTPVAVLVDRETASASEVLAAALQDHRVAALVGEATYGKGMVQTIHTFDRWGTRAKVTSSYYYSPSHRNFEHTVDPGRDYGIRPDVEVPLTRAARERLYTFLESYGPGPEVIPALEAWEAQEGTRLIEPHPEDPQLEAALELLRGRRPGPHRLQR